MLPYLHIIIISRDSMKAAIVKTNSIIEIKNLEKSPLGSREILV